MLLLCKPPTIITKSAIEKMFITVTGLQKMGHSLIWLNISTANYSNLKVCANNYHGFNNDQCDILVTMGIWNFNF